MPLYAFRAVSEQNTIVKGKIKDATKDGAVKKLKANNLAPISVQEALEVVVNPETTKQRRNLKVADENKKKSTAAVMSKKQESLTEKVNKFAMQATNQKVTTRDIRIFSQNFYLL